jgi:hypothetical protein
METSPFPNLAAKCPEEDQVSSCAASAIEYQLNLMLGKQTAKESQAHGSRFPDRTGKSVIPFGKVGIDIIWTLAHVSIPAIPCPSKYTRPIHCAWAMASQWCFC